MNLYSIVGISLLAGSVGAFPAGTRSRWMKISCGWCASAGIVAAAVAWFGPPALPYVVAVVGIGLVVARVSQKLAPGEPWAA
jgi:hypothetical protein